VKYNTTFYFYLGTHQFCSMTITSHYRLRNIKECSYTGSIIFASNRISKTNSEPGIPVFTLDPEPV